MEVLVIALLGVIAFIAWAPKEATQIALAGVWALMGLWLAGTVIYVLCRALFT